MFAKRTFTQRFGAPALFIFKGQVWDSHLADSSPGDKRCAVCHRHIRFVFILKKTQTTDPLAPPEIGKLEVGRCCFHYFRKWNKDLFWELFHALQYEINREGAIRRDKKLFGDHTAIRTRQKMWRSLKRQVASRLRDLRKSNTPAPVGTVTELMKAASRKPATYKRPASAVLWYDKQIRDLQQKIEKLSV